MPSDQIIRDLEDMHVLASVGEPVSEEAVNRVWAAVDRLRAQLAAIRLHWSDGIGRLHNPWRVQMSALVGDVEGLEEAIACVDESVEGIPACVRELAREALEAAKEQP